MVLVFEFLRNQDHLNAKTAQATTIRRTLAGDPVDCGRTHALLAHIAVSVGNHAGALEHMNTALAIFGHHDRLREIAIVCGNIGEVYLRKTDLTQAHVALRHSLEIAERIGDVSSMSVSIGNLGIIEARTGNISEAAGLYRRGLTLAEQVNDPIYRSFFSGSLAITLRDQNKLQEARQALCHAFKIARTSRLVSCISYTLLVLGHMYLAQTMLEEDTCTQSLDRLKGSRGNACTRLLQQAKISLQRAL